CRGARKNTENTGAHAPVSDPHLIGALHMFDTATSLADPRRTTHPDRFAGLRSQLRGTVLTIGDPEYDVARRTVSLRSNRCPAAIVRAEDAQDVAAAVTFARTHDLPIAVRSGGHSIPLLSL